MHAFRVTLIFKDDKIVLLLDVHASSISDKYKKTTDRYNIIFNQFIKRWIDANYVALDDGPTALVEYDNFLDCQDKEVIRRGRRWLLAWTFAH